MKSDELLLITGGGVLMAFAIYEEYGAFWLMITLAAVFTGVAAAVRWAKGA